jgi:plastocyanin
MKGIRTILMFLVLGVATTFVVGAEQDTDKTVMIRDDCDSDDPAWDPTGGCTRKHGDVSFAEFNTELSSPLSGCVVGHQAWRNDPPYLQINPNQSVKVRNRGGRGHTFTKVANFGGGNVPPLNQGLVPAPECATATTLAPGETMNVMSLTPGNHRFQCCIHPWMRALVKVESQD